MAHATSRRQRAIDDGAIDTLVDHFAGVTSPMTELHVHHVGGAVAQVPAGATAFGERGVNSSTELHSRKTAGRSRSSAPLDLTGS